MVTGDHSGFVKYWQSNMNNVKAFQAHKEAVRDIRYAEYHILYLYRVYSNLISSIHILVACLMYIFSFSPTDAKFVSCSDDVTLKIWDFGRCKEENVLTGHGWDVKCVSWHPYKSLIVSGSKDNLIKVDPFSSLPHHRKRILFIAPITSSDAIILVVGREIRKEYIHTTWTQKYHTGGGMESKWKLAAECIP